VSCTADAAVNLLWSVAVSGSLSLDLWDALAVALDQPGAALQSQQLQQVFEAYCLVVLRIGAPLLGRHQRVSWLLLQRRTGVLWWLLLLLTGCSCRRC